MQPQPTTGNSVSAVRFPVIGNRRAAAFWPPQLRDLLPRHWRRVVIQGQHYWLPGPS